MVCLKATSHKFFGTVYIYTNFIRDLAGWGLSTKSFLFLAGKFTSNNITSS